MTKQNWWKLTPSMLSEWSDIDATTQVRAFNRVLKGMEKYNGGAMSNARHELVDDAIRAFNDSARRGSVPIRAIRPGYSRKLEFVHIGNTRILDPKEHNAQIRRDHIE